ncbi:hypothetical protein M514_08167 [Trichuris suis]|uniref:DM13 domain-containing protein n=1 Tax=Trichuris suis TaxID=68888 RepID=A0A085NR17_9BILA|nr:hypothetical protein M514_08167 [Trichuris suis]
MIKLMEELSPSKLFNTSLNTAISGAFFFGSADAQPKIKLDVIDSKASDPSAAVSRHQNEDILLELPPGTNVAGVKWIHLYDPRAAATLASFQLSNADKLPCLI